MIETFGMIELSEMLQFHRVTCVDMVMAPL